MPSCGRLKAGLSLTDAIHRVERLPLGDEARSQVERLSLRQRALVELSLRLAEVITQRKEAQCGDYLGVAHLD